MIYSNSEKGFLRELNREHIRKNYKWESICIKFMEEIREIYKEYEKYIEKYGELQKKSLEYFTQEKWLETINVNNNLLYFFNVNEIYTCYLNNGVCFYKLGQYKMAKHNFKLAKSINNDFNINKNLAILELEKDNVNKFIKYAQAALQFKFDCFIASLVAEKLELIGNYHEAIGMYESVLRIEPNNLVCLNNLGNIYLYFINALPNIDETIVKTYGKSLEICNLIGDKRKKELVLSNIIFNNLYNWKLTDEEIYNRLFSPFFYF